MSEAAALNSGEVELVNRGLRAVPAPDARPSPAPAPRLEIPPYDLASARALAGELGVSHALAQVLTRRGFSDPAVARAYLEAPEEHDPACFAGIDRALALIRGHVEAGTRITVHGDYDVDGVCATAILVRALRSLGADVGWFLPSRIDDGYGLSLATVNRLAARGTRLLVTVDCAITAVEEVAAARTLGLDVVVTDHHSPRPDGALPEAPIIHPVVCGYPYSELCGTAVAFKLAQALRAETVLDDLDLVALATVADLVPLTGENRRLVRTGIRALANTAKLGLRALMAVSRTDPSGLNAQALGFRVAPRINAAGRLYRADAGVELLLTEDESRAREIAAELDAANFERRAVEQRMTWEAEAQVAQLGERSAYVLAAEGWHPGVIGIVASRIVERQHRPTILIALDHGEGSGSGRSIPGFDLLAALHAAAGELIRYGGHRAAAGLTIRPERIPALRAAIERHADQVLSEEMLTPVERVDAIVSGPELGMAFAEELVALEPCGIGNPAPRLLIPGARFGDPRPMGEGRHLRFSVRSGAALARAVSFGCDGQLDVEPGVSVNATFRLDRNVWNGAVEPRLVLRHAQPCSPGAVQVLGEPASYLGGVFAELDRPLDVESNAQRAFERRAVIDRRGESPLAVLADTVSGGASVLAVCADVDRRLEGLSGRVGGFSLAAAHAVRDDPSLLDGFDQIVVLDPPCGPHERGLMSAGCGFTHWCWGEPELRFTQQMHELEYGLRASLVALYRSLRERQRVAGQELEHLLRGTGVHSLPARLAGRLIRVLAELELVSLDRDLPALTIGSRARTALESSPAYRAYTTRYEDGRRYLSANHRPSD